MRHIRFGVVLLLALTSMTVASQALPTEGYTPRFDEGDCIFARPEPSIICGTLTVPEDRTNPAGRQVRLAVVIFPAVLQPSLPDPLIYLEGGPGFSALYGVNRWVDHPARANRDIIIFDQRGTGFSEPSLNCPEIENNDPAQFTNPVSNCFFRIQQEEGIGVEHYDSAASAADVRDLAVALGAPQVNLYGISYGSRLALTVIRDYPDTVRSGVLDAIFPPEADLVADRISNRFRAFELLFGDCQADPACRAAFPDIQETFFRVVERYNENPYQLARPNPGFPDVLTGDGIVNALFLGMYNTPALPMIPYGVYRLDRAENDDDVLFGYFMVHGFLTPETYRARRIPQTPSIRDTAAVQLYEDNFGDVSYSEGLYLSVNCADEIAFSDENEATRLDADRVPPTLRDWLVNDVGGIAFGCSAWGVPSNDAIEEQRVESDVPVLLLGGAYDPITPIDWMMSARAGLPNNKLVVFTYGGHGVSLDNPCGIGLVVAHVNAPELAPDTSCSVGEINFYTED
ncbi:MAG: alpha/beta fold hydrolase [Chloroflexota bacterium]